MRLFPLLLFLAALGTISAIREWKSYENGKVESHRRRVVRLNKNHSADSEGRKEHILHAHRSEKLKKHHDRDTVDEPIEASNEQTKWNTYKKNKERHHKMEKKLHFHEDSGPAHPIPKPVTKEKVLPKGLVDIKDSSQEDISLSSSQNKRSKPDDAKSILWRRAQKEAEKARIEEIKNRSAELGLDKPHYTKRQKRKAQSKKLTISRMDGNQTAKKAWKEAFRGADRIIKTKDPK